jgi:hypothetical protein
VVAVRGNRCGAGGRVRGRLGADGLDGAALAAVSAGRAAATGLRLADATATPP